MIKYSQSNNLKCSRCFEDIKNDKKPVKVLTLKLKQASNRKTILEQKIRSLERKIDSILKQKNTKKAEWLKQAGKDLTILKDKIKEYEDTNLKTIHCEKCGYSQSFHINDAFQLRSLLLRQVEASGQQA